MSYNKIANRSERHYESDQVTGYPVTYIEERLWKSVHSDKVKIAPYLRQVLGNEGKIKVHPQGGVVYRKTTRDEREAHQRKLARERYKALRKLVPKRDRSNAVRREREEKIISSWDDVERQSWKRTSAIAGGLLGACAIAGIAIEARRIVRAARRSARKADRIMDESANMIQVIVDQLKNIGNTLNNCFGVLYYISILVAGVWCYTSLQGNLIAQSMVVAALANVFGPSIWEIVQGLFVQVEHQSAFSNLGTALASIMCFLYLPGESTRFIPEVLRRVGSLPRAGQGFESLFNTCLDFVESVINVIAKFSGQEPIYFGDAMTRQVKQWAYDAEALESELSMSKKDNPSPEFIRKVFDKIQDGYHLKHVVHEERLKLAMQKALDRLEAKLRPYESQLMAAKSYRVEPEFLLLYGESAQGKTTLITRIAQSLLILSDLCEPKDAMSNMWQKGDSKYFESYCGQKCMVMDDVFQEKVVPGMEGNEFMQVIRMVGNWSYPLNMASVDLKAKFFFTSPLVIGTTNLSSIQQTTAAQVIFAPEAVARRVHRCLKIEAAPDFRTPNGELDYAKVEQARIDRINLLKERRARGESFSKIDVLETFPWDAWVATKWDWSKGQSLVETVNLREYVSDMAKAIKLKIERHNASAASIDEFNELLACATDGECEIQPQSGGDKPHIGYKPFRRFSWFATGDEPGANYAYPPIHERVELADRLEKCSNSIIYDGVNVTGKKYETTPQGVKRAYIDASLNAHPNKGGSDAQMAELNAKWDEWSQLYERVEKYDYEWRRFVDNCGRFMGSLWEEFKLSPLATTVTLLVGVVVWTSIAALIIRAIRAIRDMIVVAIGAMMRFVQGLFGVKDADPQSNVKDSVPKKKDIPPFRTSVVNQAFDGSQMEVKHNIVYENTYKLVIDDLQVMIGQITFVRGYVAIMPTHFLEDIRSRTSSGMVLTLVSVSNAQNVFKIDRDAFLSQEKVNIANNDLTFMKFTLAGFQARRDIVKHMLTSEQLWQLTKDSHSVRLDVCDCRYADGVHQVSRIVMHAPRIDYHNEIAVAGKKTENLVSYRMDTAVGMCGAPLMLNEPKYFGGKCFIGIHVAGTARVFHRIGFATPVSFELANEVLGTFEAVEDKFEEDLESRGVNVKVPDLETQSALKEAGLIAGSFELLYEVDRPWNLAPNTKLKRSFVGEQQLLGPCDQRPAHLRPVLVDGVKRYPMIEGLRNYQSVLEDIKVENIDSFVDIATWKFRQETMYEKRRLFSFSEAVKGVEGLKIKAINRSTSPGFPYVYHTSKGKTAFFGESGDFDLESDACKELEARVEYVISEARKGVRCAHVCIDFLKDELRSKEKVDNCQTRIISGSPLDYVLACRRMFGAFIAASFRHHTKTGVCPGINPYSDWWVLADHIKGMNRTKVFDGDFKRFDASEQPVIHWAILRFINKWYNDGVENARIREVLWLDLVHSRHLTGVFGDARYIVQWSKSLPSGHPLTTIVNSWYAMITLTVCYCELTRDPLHMWDNIGPAVFGDDNIVGVSDDVSEAFNQVTVANAMKQYFNLTYTSGSKTGELKPYQALQDCTFLKRSFLEDDSDVSHGWAAPLDKNSFLFTSYYYKNSRCFTSEMVDKLNGTLGEMCLHSPEVWEEHAPVVIRLLREEFGAEPLFQDREQFRAATSMRTDFWF